MVVIAAVGSDPRENVLQEARQVSEAFDDTVHVVHVIERDRLEEDEKTTLNVKRPEEEVLAIATERAKSAAEGVLSAYSAVGLVGDRATELIRYAERRDARYIVVGGRKRSKLGKVLFGSVTQSVLMSAPCPVVAVTPAGEPRED